MTEKILIIEDDESMRRSVVIALRRSGWSCTPVASVAEAMAQLDTNDFDLVLSDLRLPDGDGLDVARRAAERLPDAPVVIMTAYASVETAVDAMRDGVVDFLSKPFAPEQLIDRVKSALLARPSARRATEVLQSPADPPAIVGRGPSIATLRHGLELASTARTALIVGETGSGKELVARTIHASGSPQRPYVAVNCSGLDAAAVDSELFGHVAGAFTGADADRTGSLATADGGTLFIDEVGELPKSTQAKLLAFLESGTVCAIGSDEATPVQVRLLAATNRQLEHEVAAHRFSRALLDRLGHVRVVVPPLRERPEDLPELCMRLIDRIAARLHCRAPGLGEGVLDVLAQHDWPGNVRELENVLERAMLVTSSIDLERADIVIEVAGARASPPSTVLADVEREHILRVLDQVKGHRERACMLLGISRSTLRRKLNEYREAGWIS